MDETGEPLETGFIVLNILGFIILVMFGAYAASKYIFFDFRHKLLVMLVASFISFVLVGFLFVKAGIL